MKKQAQPTTDQPALAGIIEDGPVMALVSVESHDIRELFTTPGALDPIIERVREAVADFKADTTTEQGRKAITSLAYKIVRTKTYLDGKGMDLVAELKALPKLIDENRRKMRDSLDALAEEKRKPLTDWENDREKERAFILRLNQFPVLAMGKPSVEIRALLEELDAIQIDPKSPIAPQATEAKAKALAYVSDSLAVRIKAEADAEELENLRKKQAERDKADREEELRVEGEKRARMAQERPSAPPPSVDTPEPPPASPGTSQPPATALPPSSTGGDLEHRREFNREALVDLTDLIFNFFDPKEPNSSSKMAEVILRAIVKNQVRHISITY